MGGDKEASHLPIHPYLRWPYTRSEQMSLKTTLACVLSEYRVNHHRSISHGLIAENNTLCGKL